MAQAKKTNGLEKEAQRLLKEYGCAEVFGTEDGQFFFKEGLARIHAYDIKSEVKVYKSEKK